MKRGIFFAIILTLFIVPCFAQDANPLFVITVDGKRGFIDKTGKIAIEPQFEGVDDFSDDLAEIYVPGKYSTAYIDKTGRIAIQPQFDIGSKFSEGFAWVGFSPDKREYKAGNLTLYTSPPSDSFNYNIGFIDRAGNFITQPVFTFAGDFSEGLAVVRTKENKFGYIDKTGKLAIEPKFDWAEDFSEGLALVYIDGKYGFIDKTGKVVIKPQFTDAKSFSEDLACVKIGGRVREPGWGVRIITTTAADTNYAYIDKAGKIIFKLNAGEAHSFSDGLAKFEILGKYGYGFVDKTGKIVIKPKFGGSSDFSEGLKVVILDEGKLGYIDKTGSVVLKPSFGNLDDFKNGLARVCESYESKAKCGYIDKTGKLVWNPTN